MAVRVVIACNGNLISSDGRQFTDFLRSAKRGGMLWGWQFRIAWRQPTWHFISFSERGKAAGF
jgi:hypothetical protein